MPLDMPTTRRAPVVLAHMHMLQMLPDRSVPRRYILLFDVRVERIEQNTDLRMIDLVAKRRRIRRRIQKIGLETIERLDRQDDIVLRQRIAQ